MNVIRPGPDLFWVEQPFAGRLGVSRRPLGFTELEDEVAGWRASGLDVIVSMLEANEADDLGLAHQEPICRRHGLIHVSCPVPDRGLPPDRAAFVAVADAALAHLAAGRRVAAHCFAGIGRSPLFVATVLVRHGLDPEAAWMAVRAARRLDVPDTEAQWNWLEDLGSAGQFGNGR